MPMLRTVGTFLLTIGVALPLAAQSITTQRDDAASTTGARGITVADLNRDGWLDIATANHAPNGVSVLLNRGASGGYTASFIPIAGGPFDVVAADFNRDGLPDLAVANPDANEINVLFGLAAGGFRAPLHIGAQFNPRSLAAGDIDNDGRQDIVYTLYNNQGVQILYGDGAGNFAMRTGPGTAGINPQGVAIADFNMDGWNDLVVAASGSLGLTILYQTAGGVGTFSRKDLSVPSSQNVVVTGDFNRDGRPDIAAASTGTSDITIVINGKTAMTTLVYASGGGSTRGIAAIDLNRDGAVDVVTGNRGTSTIQVLPGKGDGTFGSAYGFAAGSGARAVAAGDFDNDGRVDMASANEYAPTVTVLGNTTAFTRSAFAFSRTKMGPSDPVYGAAEHTGIADFDLDGKLDAATQDSGDGVVVLLGSGGSTTVASQPYGPASIHAALLNADAYPDVVFLDMGVNPGDRAVIEAYLGNGSGQFPVHKTTQTLLSPLAIETADFNRDGRTDLTMIGYDSAYSKATIQVYLGNGDGTFTAGSTLSVTTNNGVVMIGDVDRDGDADIVSYSTPPYWSTEPAIFYTWLNSGGAFTTAPRTLAVTAWNGIYGGQLGDANHDGWLDLVAGGYPVDGDLPHKGVAFFAGSAAGFGAPAFVDIGTYYSFAPSLTDLTMDGNLDVVSPDGAIFAGRGDGTFAPPDRFDFYAPEMQVIDFNKDGLPDIVSNETIGSVQILLNQHRDTNLAPTVTLGPDWTINYRDQFGEGDYEFWAQGSDPDLHGLTYKWYDAQGQLLADTGPFPYWTPPRSNPGTYQFTVVADDGRGATARDTLLFIVRPQKEVVIWPGGFYPRLEGTKWSVTGDATAAGGAALHDRNDGAPKVTSPLASPASYATVDFVADPTQTYKLWVRLKADGNGTANDSLWLQFSGGVDANGKTYEPGSTSGIEVVLEECSGCGIAGWGWRDEAWGQKGAIGTLTLRFPAGGTQQLRIQTREDGVNVDQVVLSAEQFRATRPGLVKNDGTILPGTPFY